MNINKTAVFYFSGTGNTELISELIKDKMSGHKTDLYRIEDILNGIVKVKINDYDMVGIGFPSIGFNPPRIAVDFIKGLDRSDQKKVFLFLTCAGPCYLNDVAFFGIKKILRQKNYSVIYELVVCMPANILLRYDDEIIKRLHMAAVKKVERMAHDITDGITKTRNDRFLPYLFRWFLIPLERLSIITVPLDFIVEKECSKCMKCISVCPRHNIVLKKAIKHGLNCEACYRCVYSCPSKAIKGHIYNFVICKDGYDIKKAVERVKNIKVIHPLRGIFKTLEPYFNQENT